MAHDYNNPTDQMKAISWQLKRIADSLEGIESALTQKPSKQNDCFDHSIRAETNTTMLKDFIGNLK